MPNEQDHKWLTTQTREAIEEFGLMLESREFARTKKRARIAFKLAAQTWAVLLGRAPFPTDARDVARIMDALDIFETENPQDRASTSRLRPRARIDRGRRAQAARRPRRGRRRGACRLTAPSSCARSAASSLFTRT